MLVISVLIKAGVFESLASHLSGVGAYLPVPASGLSIIVAMFGNNIAAYTIASNLLAVGEISAQGIILSLLIGAILSNTVYMLRSSLPIHIGIFGIKTGIQITLLSSAIRNGIIIVFIVMLALFWQ